MKRIKTLGRLLTLAISLPAMVPCLVAVILAMLWWQFVGFVTWIFGARARKFVGRWLGCYPFVYALLLVLGCAAWFHWSATGEKFKSTYASLCSNCLDKLESDKGLAKIGGLW